MCPKDADGMANSVDPDQTAPLRAVWSVSTLFAQTSLSANLADSMQPVCQLTIFPHSIVYTTLPHNLIKEKLIKLTEWTFKREGSPDIACNERQAFFTSGDTKQYKLWSCQNLCEALIYLLDNIYIRFGTKLYRQIVGIPMVLIVLLL